MNKRYVRIDFMVEFDKFEEMHNIISKVKDIIENSKGSQIVLTVDSHNRNDLDVPLVRR